MSYLEDYYVDESLGQEDSMLEVEDSFNLERESFLRDIESLQASLEIFSIRNAELEQEVHDTRDDVLFVGGVYEADLNNIGRRIVSLHKEIAGLANDVKSYEEMVAEYQEDYLETIRLHEESIGRLEAKLEEYVNENNELKLGSANQANTIRNALSENRELRKRIEELEFDLEFPETWEPDNAWEDV